MIRYKADALKEILLVELLLIDDILFLQKILHPLALLNQLVKEEIDFLIRAREGGVGFCCFAFEVGDRALGLDDELVGVEALAGLEDFHCTLVIFDY